MTRDFTSETNQFSQTRIHRTKSPIKRILISGIFAAVVFVALPVRAQQVTGELGSPSATTSIDGRQLPAPDPKFGGVIKNDALSSKPWWAPRIVPPKRAPNVLLIITDDAGFGVPSTFGGVDLSIPNNSNWNMETAIADETISVT